MKIIFLDSTHQHLIDELSKNSFICHQEFSKTKEQIENIIEDYDGVIIRSRFKIDKKFIDAGKNLKFIARAGSGLENIDIKYAKQKNIICINAGEGNKQAVAEHALSMILNLINKINQADYQIRNGKWLREDNRGLELSKKTFGIIGYGNTGSAFVNLLKNFNVKILVYDKYKKNYPFNSSMKKIFNEADFISLHIPLSNETENLVNKTFINQVKKPFYLINTSRGRCVKTNELINAIKKEKILGACLDVFEFENNSFENIKTDNINLDFLIKSNKTILTPHIAGWTHESYYKIAKILSEKIIKELM